MPLYHLKFFKGLVQIGADQNLQSANDRLAREECFALASDFGRLIFEDLKFIPNWRLELFNAGDHLMLKITASVDLGDACLSPYSGTVVETMAKP